jgi:hypothetical protein
MSHLTVVVVGGGEAACSIGVVVNVDMVFIVSIGVGRKKCLI